MLEETEKLKAVDNENHKKIETKKDDAFFDVHSQQQININEFEAKQSDLENKIYPKEALSSDENNQFDKIDKKLDSLCKFRLYQKFEPTSFDF